MFSSSFFFSFYTSTSQHSNSAHLHRQPVLSAVVASPGKVFLCLWCQRWRGWRGKRTGVGGRPRADPPLWLLSLQGQTFCLLSEELQQGCLCVHLSALGVSRPQGISASSLTGSIQACLWRLVILNNSPNVSFTINVMCLCVFAKHWKIERNKVKSTVIQPLT